MQDDWLSNTYLVGDEEGGTAVVIDAGGPCAPLLEAAERLGLDVQHAAAHPPPPRPRGRGRRPGSGVEILAHPLEAEQLDGVDRTIEPGDTLEVGGLRDRDAAHARATPPGCSTSWSTASDVFTGDTLFKGSVGGVRAPGSTSFADLRHSIMDVLMELPHETRVHPGHTDPTTIGDEWEQQRVRPPLARARRGGQRAAARCGTQEATLVLWAPDYDGGHKAWVRWDDGSDDIVPGSRSSARSGRWTRCGRRCSSA